ncbi:MAG: ATP phosphoribosyltransferase [Candidatus Magasanikbacteria bacterium]|jgi:ATP phosphoribosyltransferase|nr:ATP phosphoribosyltransferase [Candidatus Magasanikbacteria bacterium]MBT4314870.1 ATP phosphoribosyltransferase [Candidatus Magasanikbacteria bacterium]MBT4546743.1 ATP phosphoribosyltransferase [Candidatus Magasanikbacteria bacterium]MBT6819648.1 ATP phosphoribosyltransferase [Candidatus Magasanikbacteria bacterium]
MKNKLKIAIQKKGHLREESIDFLLSLGLNFDYTEKTLSTNCQKTNAEIIFLRDDDIPKYLNEGLIDFGIIGKDVIEEREESIKTNKTLGFSKCELVIASPQNSQIKKIEDLQNKVIATSYPNILKKYLKEKKIYSKVIYLSGSVEIAPKMGLADLICDITQTGRSLKENKLQIIEVILESEAVLIESPINKSQKNNIFEKIEKYANRKSQTI